MPLRPAPSTRIEAALRAGRLRFVADAAARADYTPFRSIPTFRLTGTVVAFASPDSTYAATSRLISAAKKSILVGIYDFTAPHLLALLLGAMERGVVVTVKLDTNGDNEEQVLKRLRRLGAETVTAASVSAGAPVAFFDHSHEKVIVIDRRWTIVQSGNWSPASVPPNDQDGVLGENFRSGNRDMGVAIENSKIAAFFSRVIQRDIDLATELAPQAAVAAPSVPVFVSEAAAAPPPKVFPSKTFAVTKPIDTTPVLTPDNYMAVVPNLLAAARRSLILEQQYIRPKSERVGILLDAIATAIEAAPGLEVRIVVASPFSSADSTKTQKEVQKVLVRLGLRMGHNLRFLNKKHFKHCHNKLVVVDGKHVLVGSQNWSETAVGTNREASLLFLGWPALARYFTSIFNVDWETGLKRVPASTHPEFFEADSFARGGMMVVSPGDYEEV